jgi:hypothetical protein
VTKDQVKQLVVFTLANYPHLQDKEMGPTITLWEKMLEDIPYELAENAIIKIIATAKFWPTVAEIREAAVSLQNPNMITPAEAWSQANAALDKYGYYRADEGMAVLSPAIKKTIRALGGFESICTTENIETVRAQFLRMYDQFAKSEKENALLPESVRQFIAGAVKELTGAVGQ